MRKLNLAAETPAESLMRMGFEVRCSPAVRCYTGLSKGKPLQSAAIRMGLELVSLALSLRKAESQYL